MTDLSSEEAIAWFACMHSDRRTRTDEDRFAQWLKQDERYEMAYARVEKVWRAAGPPIVPRSAAAIAAKERRSRLPIGKLSMAAAIVALGIGSAFFFAHRGLISSGSFVTPTGSQQELKLSDGSVLTLNTRSEVSIDFDDAQRVVHLVRGEARFKVAKDASRPFVVDTGTARVRALGTKFDVRVSDSRVAVTLVEGLVEVASAGLAPSARAPVILKPGQQLAIDVENGKERIKPVNLEHVDAWLHHQLIFDAMPLVEAVEEANRYLPKPVVIEDSSLSAIRVSGVVRAGSLESFVGALESSFPIRAEEGRSGTTLVRKSD